MPKRRMTPARKRQIEQWRLKGAGSRVRRQIPKATQQVQARINSLNMRGLTTDAKKPVPVGKTVLLMHRTTEGSARNIIRGGYKVTHTNTPVWNLKTGGGHVYGLLPYSVNSWKGYGPAIVGVKVSRKKVSVDRSMETYYPPPYKVRLSDLKGRKFKRYK